MRKPKTQKSAIANQPSTAPSPSSNKLERMVELLRQPNGTQIDELMTATGWQAHSVRGAISGTLKKKRQLQITSEKTEAGRVYRIVDEAAA